MSKCFILELEMIMNSKTKYKTDSALQYGRHIFNSTMGYALKNVNMMRQSKKYRFLLKEYRKVKNAKSDEDKALKSKISDELNEIRLKHKLSKYQLENYATNFKNNHSYDKYIDSNTVLNIAGQVWDSIEKLIFFKSKRVHFKKFGQFNSLEGKTNKQGIRFIKSGENYSRKVSDKNMVLWNGIKMPVKIRKNDLYAEEILLNHKVKFCRIIRKFIKNKYKYYIQLTFDGVPPVKRNKDGSFRHRVNLDNNVGLDIGTTTLAVCSEESVSLTKLGGNDIDILNKIIRRLHAKLDRSRRANNPNNYNNDGTIKKGIKLRWNYSKGYFRALKQLKESYRLKAVKLKLNHRILANKLLSLGTNIYVENMSFKGLAKKSKETKISTKTGRFKSKKRFGKSISNYAPAMLLSIVNQKLGYYGLKLNKVNTSIFKASQYNHVTNTYKKKKLSQRWTLVDNFKVQRDLYSAFLIMNSKSNLKKCDRNLCIKTFDKFINLHDIEISKLKLSLEKLPLSFGIKQQIC